MNLAITCGPAFEPIDAVRRLTNFSTGRTGVGLAEYFREQGHHVDCLRGRGATFRPHSQGIHFSEFGTNADLEKKLEGLGHRRRIDAVFHTAALCDFGVAAVEALSGRPISAGKLASRAEGYRLRLRPLPKLLHRLRDLFPRAFLVGWKYEVDGGREEAVAAGRRQLEESRTDLCVLNGPAYGSGYGILSPDGELARIGQVGKLAATLLQRLEEHQKGKK